MLSLHVAFSLPFVGHSKVNTAPKAHEEKARTCLPLSLLVLRSIDVIHLYTGQTNTRSIRVCLTPPKMEQFH